MATSANTGSSGFLDRYRTNLNTPRGTSYVPGCYQCNAARSAQTQNYGNQPQNYGNQPQNYGNQPQNYGNQPQNYGNQPQNYGNQPQNYGNQYDTSALRSSGNVYRDERVGNEILARAGPNHHYQHPEYRTHEVIAPDGRLDNLNVQSDNDPLRIVRPADQNVHYKQQVNVRFLAPPAAPEPAPIIIKERHAPAPPALPPVVIRQRPPTPPTPPPLIIRERPPTPPVQQQPQVIEKVLPAQPAPPRQVIVERLPHAPPKPRQVIYEKWLPYEDMKERPVIVQRAPPPEVMRPPKNIIIQHEQPKAHHEQVITDEGVFHADPQTHHASSAPGEVRVVDRITDLPVNYSKYLTNRGLSSRSPSSSSLYDQRPPPQPQYSQAEPQQQYRSSSQNYPGAYSTTYRSSYTHQNNNRPGVGPYGGNQQPSTKYV